MAIVWLARSDPSPLPGRAAGREKRMRNVSMLPVVDNRRASHRDRTRGGVSRRGLVKLGLAAAAALSAAAAGAVGEAATAGVRRPTGSGALPEGSVWAGDVIRTWNEVARSQPFANGPRLARALA